MIRRRREEAELSLSDVARKTGRAVSVVRAWEMGQHRVPADAMPSLADALGTTVDDLFREAATC
ncbi:MAG: helix-turn-helix domain-containing protein [Gemmatimonadota bacterium]